METGLTTQAARQESGLTVKDYVSVKAAGALSAGQ